MSSRQEEQEREAHSFQSLGIGKKKENHVAGGSPRPQPCTPSCLIRPIPEKIVASGKKKQKNKKKKHRHGCGSGRAGKNGTPRPLGIFPFSWSGSWEKIILGLPPCLLGELLCQRNPVRIVWLEGEGLGV